MFSQIHFSKSSLPDFSEQAVMAQLLSDTISHTPGHFPLCKKTRVLKGDAFKGRTMHPFDQAYYNTCVCSCLCEKRRRKDMFVDATPDNSLM